MISNLVTAMRRNLVAWLALFVALGGTSLAASHYVINSTKQVNPKVLKKLEGRAGPKGATGARGATGATGPPGSVSTSNFFTKSESDGRYLAAGGTALDSSKLGGLAADEYTTGRGAQGGRWEALIDKQEEANFLFVPQVGEISANCSVSGAKVAGIKLTQHAGGGVFFTWATYPREAANKLETGLLQNDDDHFEQTVTSTEHGGGQMIIGATAIVAGADVFSNIIVSVGFENGECRVQVNYTVADQT